MMTADTPPAYVAAIDGGQTGTRIRLTSLDAPQQSFDTAPIRTDQPVVPQLADRLLEVAARRQLHVTAIAAGVSGLTDTEMDACVLLDALELLGVERAVLAHDSATGYLSANRYALGSVTAAGTGVVTLGVGERIARVDGWGNLIGDAGSAYWIGRQGLDAAMRSFDGRAGSSMLLRAMTERFGDPAALYMTLQADPARVPVVASFAATVAACSDAGDNTAHRILLDAGNELGVAAVAALERSGSNERPQISWAGTVLVRNDVIRNAMIEHVLRMYPTAAPVAPFGDPLSGVELLLTLPPDHPLNTSVSVATRAPVFG